MKKLIVSSLTSLTILSIIATTYYTNQSQLTVQSQQSTKQTTSTEPSQPITHSYIITKVVHHDNEDTEYYGKSTTGDTGIYFTSDYIK